MQTSLKWFIKIRENLGWGIRERKQMYVNVKNRQVLVKGVQESFVFSCNFSVNLKYCKIKN